MSELTLLPATPGSMALSQSVGLLLRIRRHKFVFGATVLVSAVLLAIVIVLLPPIYRATSQVIIAAQQPLAGTFPEARIEKIGDPADMEGQILILRSARLQGAVLDRPSVQSALQQECAADASRIDVGAALRLISPGKPCSEKLRGKEGLEWLAKHFVIGADGRSRVLNINYDSAVPAVAQTLANALTDEYLKDSQQIVRESRSQAVEWLDTQIARTGEKLQADELAIERFRGEHGLINGEGGPIASERLSAAAQQLARAEAARADADAKLRSLRDTAAGQKIDTVGAVLQSRTVGLLKQQLAKIDADLARMSYNYHAPVVEALVRQRDAVQVLLTQETQAIAASIQRDYDSATMRVAELQKQVHQFEGIVIEATRAEATIAAMVHGMDVQREVYLDLTRRANELGIQSRVLSGEARLVSYAGLPNKVWFPKRLPFAAVGLVFSLGLACAAAVLWDQRDSTVRGSFMLEALTGSRVLASIPHARRARLLISGAPHGKKAGSSPIEEAVRILHARVMSKTAGQPRRLLVASSHSGEGKTFTVLALARFAALAGRRVLAIEADLRHPRFASLLSVSGRPGLSEFLRGQASLEEIKRTTGVPGLDVIPAGSPAVDSTELLARGRLEELLTAEADYDLILVDSPPSQVLMDARIIAPLLDGVIYSARWGHSHSGAVLEGLRGIAEAGGRVDGLAINMIRRRKLSLYDVDSLPTQGYLGRSSA